MSALVLWARVWALRLIGGAPLLDAARFYAQDEGSNLRGTASRWSPECHQAPQPHKTFHGEPSMWDNGSIARWALESWGDADPFAPEGWSADRPYEPCKPPADPVPAEEPL